jgi:hypothetical protein
MQDEEQGDKQNEGWVGSKNIQNKNIVRFNKEHRGATATAPPARDRFVCSHRSRAAPRLRYQKKRDSKPLALVRADVCKSSLCERMSQQNSA